MYINQHKWKEAIVFWDQEFKISEDIDVYYLIHEYSKKRGKNISEHINFKTTLNSETPEDNFSSSTRRKWRKLEGYTYSLKNKLPTEELKGIIEKYNIFAKEANLTKMDGNIYKQMNDEKKLYVSKAFKDEKLHYIHTFYVSQDTARLFHTFPIGNPNTDLNIGLHRFELVEFKNKGIKTYDWGGAGFINEENDKKLSIREYKRRFGGEEFIYYKARVAGNKFGERVINEYYKF